MLPLIAVSAENPAPARRSPVAGGGSHPAPVFKPAAIPLQGMASLRSLGASTVHGPRLSLARRLKERVAPPISVRS